MDRRKRIESGSDGTAEQVRQIERLQRDLTRRERELEEERRETEKTIDRMRTLEKDKIELKRELDEVRDEVTEYQRLVDELQEEQTKVKGHLKSPDEDEQLNTLRATLQERNREISHFIEDLERMEEEKSALKKKLTEVSASLEEATGQLTELTKDRVDLNSKLAKTDELIRRLEEDKAILQIRERELLDFKEQHDQHLENLGNAVDIRVDVWKKMMFQKDEEIERLNAKVEALLRKPSNSQLNSENQATVQHLKMKIQQRDDQIHHLVAQLQEATNELNNNNRVIANLQVQVPPEAMEESAELAVRALEKKVRKLETKIEKRTAALERTEKEAEEKAGEIVQLMARLRQYEEGQYGLADAVAEIKDLKNQLKIRDREVGKLTQEVNQFQIEGSEVVEENEMLRKQLGHGINDDLSHQRRMFVQKRSEDVNALKAKLEVKENEVTTLKTRNYELKRLLTAAQEEQELLRQSSKQRKHQSPKRVPAKEVIPSVPVDAAAISPGEEPRSRSPSPPPIQDFQGIGSQMVVITENWQEKYEIILHENTELRKGLQEILDSFQHIGESDSLNIRIESPTLENLLREMSARGLINYPYSISSFHLKVCNLEGKNSQLREELQRTRIWAEGLIEKEKQRCEEWREKAIAAQEIVKNSKVGEQSDFVQRVNHSQLETGRWKRIAEQSEKLIAMLNEKVEDSDSKVAQLEARLEEVQKEARERRERSEAISAPAPSRMESIGIQVEPIPSSDAAEDSKVAEVELRLHELQNLLAAKDEVIENLKNITASYQSRPVSRTGMSRVSVSPNPELEEALQLARESIHSLTKRLQAKEENLMAYKRILAEVRSEMQLGTDRHVQDMNALQSIIHQQQQAFTRMKSSLSHPVRDTPTDIEGALKEQLTRVNELEDCVRDLEHTMGNVASQLATARTDAHRWRVTADTRLKEIDLLREQVGVGNPHDIEVLQEKIQVQEDTIAELKRSAHTTSVLKELLEEKEIEIQALRSAGVRSKATALVAQRSTDLGSNSWIPKVPSTQESQQFSSSAGQKSEIEYLRTANQDLESKLKKLQVRLSKMNATNRASGITQEMEKLRTEYTAVLEERDSLRMRIAETDRRTDEEIEKNRKTVEGYARWDEGKKWKRTVERLEDQKRKLEEDKIRMTKEIETHKNIITRLEKEKMLHESRLKRVKSSTSEQSLFDEEVDKYRREVERLQSTLNQKELNTNEIVERLTMEAKILRERIETQERQITAYEVSTKGDPKVVAEIQKLVQSNDQLHQELVNQQQVNLDLKLQIQEMKLETPKLRERVQNLQKMADFLKSDKSSGPSYRSGGSLASSSGRNLGELEKTITALKSIVEKLDKNKVGKPTSGGGSRIRASRSASSLRERQEGIIEEKQRLMEKVQSLGELIHRAEKVQLENEARIGDLLQQRDEAQSRAQSAEMKLKTFLEQDRTKALEDEIQRKTQLLAEAKKSLETFSKMKKSNKP